MEFKNSLKLLLKVPADSDALLAINKKTADFLLIASNGHYSLCYSIYRSKYKTYSFITKT